MEFSPTKFMEWIQSMVEIESKLEYEAEKAEHMPESNYHRGRKEAFHECNLMVAGDGPCYVCKCDKNPWPELAKCLFATLVREKMKEHLRKKHEMEYKKDEMLDEYHLYKKMKEA